MSVPLWRMRVGGLHRCEGEKGCRGQTRKRQWDVSQLCGALLVCGCGRFDISGAFNPGTGNRWCWEIKLLSPQPCRSVSGVSASLSLSSFFFLSLSLPLSLQRLFFFLPASHSFFLLLFFYLLAPYFVSVVGRVKISFSPHSCVTTVG